MVFYIRVMKRPKPLRFCSLSAVGFREMTDLLVLYHVRIAESAGSITRDCRNVARLFYFPVLHDIPIGKTLRLLIYP